MPSSKSRKHSKLKKRVSKALGKSHKRHTSKSRKSPPYSARFMEGQIKKGLDGKLWISKESKNGVIKWVHA